MGKSQKVRKQLVMQGEEDRVKPDTEGDTRRGRDSGPPWEPPQSTPGHLYPRTGRVTIAKAPLDPQLRQPVRVKNEIENQSSRQPPGDHKQSHSQIILETW